MRARRRARPAPRAARAGAPRGGPDDRRRQIALQQAVVQQRQQQLVDVPGVVVGGCRRRADVGPRRPARGGGQDGGQGLDQVRLVDLVERVVGAEALEAGRWVRGRRARRPFPGLSSAPRRRRATPRARAAGGCARAARDSSSSARARLSMRAQLGARCAVGAPVATAVRAASGPMHTPASRPCGRGPEGRAPRVALQRAILAGAGLRARQRRAGQRDRAFTQRVAGEPARAPPQRRGRQQRGPEQKAGQGPIHVARVTQLRRSARGPARPVNVGRREGRYRCRGADLGGEPDAQMRPTPGCAGPRLEGRRYARRRGEGDQASGRGSPRPADRCHAWASAVASGRRSSRSWASLP